MYEYLQIKPEPKMGSYTVKYLRVLYLRIYMVKTGGMIYTYLHMSCSCFIDDK